MTKFTSSYPNDYRKAAMDPTIPTSTSNFAYCATSPDQWSGGYPWMPVWDYRPQYPQYQHFGQFGERQQPPPECAEHDLPNESNADFSASDEEDCAIVKPGNPHIRDQVMAIYSN